MVVLALQWTPGYGPNDEFTIHGMSSFFFKLITIILTLFFFKKKAYGPILGKEIKEREIKTPTDINVLLFCSSGRMAPTRGCDNSRNTNQVASIIRSMNSTIYGRMNTFWPSNKGDNNWYVFFLIPALSL